MRDRPGAFAEGLLALMSGDVDSIDSQAAAHTLADVVLLIRRALARG